MSISALGDATNLNEKFNKLSAFYHSGFGNGKDYKQFFPLEYLQNKVEAPLKTSDSEGRFDISVTVYGGGIKGQAEAISLAVARALINDNSEKRPALKKAKLLRRDARKVERKKTGLRKARKQEQFSKR